MFTYLQEADMMAGMKKPKPKEAVMLKSFTTRLPTDTIRAIKVYAAQTSGSVQDIIADAIKAYLARQPKAVKEGK
jgi:hypothetical protein